MMKTKFIVIIAVGLLLTASCEQQEKQNVPAIFKQVHSIQLMPKEKGYRPLEMFFLANPSETYVQYSNKNNMYNAKIPIKYSHTQQGSDNQASSFFDEIVDDKIEGLYCLSAKNGIITEAYYQSPKDGKRYFYAVDKCGTRNVLKMETNDGVRYVWIEVNGLKLKFVFDTGASSITISSAEATVLYKQGTLRDEDILDDNDYYFQDATGYISVRTKINLRTVKIGNRTLRNVEAMVVDSDEAPLLLGQSALSQFGRVTIDNRRNEVIFE